MSFHPIQRRDFDVAAQPGLRVAISEAYSVFRRAEADSHHLLSDSARASIVSRLECPCCYADVSTAELLFCKNGITHQHCVSCGLVYTAQLLSPEADAALYADTPFNAAYLQLKQNPLYAGLEQKKARYYIEQCLQFQPEILTVLDIGASTGAVMAAAEDLGLEGFGIEPGRTMAGLLRQRFGSRFVEGYFPQDLPQNWPSFDLITLLDVLEHMRNPLAFLLEVRTRMRPGGILMIQVPNLDSLLVRLNGAGSSIYTVGHWQHFNDGTLRRLLENAGLRCIRTDTCISELDRVATYPSDRIDAVLRQHAHKLKWPITDEQLYANKLGYKLFGLFTWDN
jgi:SAM-dependent methyltransferase